MRIIIASDLHFETHNDYGQKLIDSIGYDGDEVLVLAGDILRLDARYLKLTWLAMEQICKRIKDVVYVPGNHEFWDTTPTEGWQQLQELEREFEPLHVLHTGEVREIRGQRFLGDTMWFPFNANNHRFERNMPDFKRIEGLSKWVYAQNQNFRGFLRKECQRGDIVVTHHLPSYLSVPNEFANSQINRFFVSNMEAIISETKPQLWIHGHTHSRFDYRIKETRVVCNPRGYPAEHSIYVWNPHLVIEVPEPQE